MSKPETLPMHSSFTQKASPMVTETSGPMKGTVTPVSLTTGDRPLQHSIGRRSVRLEMWPSGQVTGQRREKGTVPSLLMLLSLSSRKASHTRVLCVEDRESPCLKEVTPAQCSFGSAEWQRWVQFNGGTASRSYQEPTPGPLGRGSPAESGCNTVVSTPALLSRTPQPLTRQTGHLWIQECGGQRGALREPHWVMHLHRIGSGHPWGSLSLDRAEPLRRKNNLSTQ